MNMRSKNPRRQLNSAKSFARFMSKSLSLPILASFLLMGCASSIRQSTTPIQANLVVPCPPIRNTDAKNLGELVVFTTDLIEQYGDCRAKHEALVKSLGN